MRSYKFRAWDVIPYYDSEDKKYEMIYFNLEETRIIENLSLESIVMQSTGLKDKNGKEIYEGDILIQNNNKADLVQVCFGEFGIRSLETGIVIDKSVGWYLKVLPTDAISKLAPFCYDMPINNYWIERLSTKVIGNIYENPELLEEIR